MGAVALNESPLFSRLYDFLLWLLPQACKFPRQYRFTVAERVQCQALDLNETLILAGLCKGEPRAARLRQANGQLTQLRHTLRLCKDLNLMTLKQYEYAAERLNEIGRLLGGWMRAL